MPDEASAFILLTFDANFFDEYNLKIKGCLMIARLKSDF
jgi:hypothetical protein